MGERTYSDVPCYYEMSIGLWTRAIGSSEGVIFLCRHDIVFMST